MLILLLLVLKRAEGAVDNFGTGDNFSVIRQYLYQLFPGNWFSKIVDLGDIPQGNEEDDTYFAIQEIIVISY